MGEIEPAFAKYFDPAQQGSLAANRWSSPDGFDDAWFAQVAQRNPAWALKLLQARQQTRDQWSDRFGALQQFFGMNQPRSTALQGINGAQVSNPNPASPLAPNWIGVRN